MIPAKSLFFLSGLWVLCCQLQVACGANLLLLPPKRSPRPPTLSSIRGGSSLTGDEKLSGWEGILRDYLDEDSQTHEDAKFYVQGWRWHTMSVMRETIRLQKLALRVEQQEEFDDEHHPGISMLQKAADYVVDFNLHLSLIHI